MSGSLSTWKFLLLRNSLLLFTSMVSVLLKMPVIWILGFLDWHSNFCFLCDWYSLFISWEIFSVRGREGDRKTEKRDEREKQRRETEILFFERDWFKYFFYLFPMNSFREVFGTSYSYGFLGFSYNHIISCSCPPKQEFHFQLPLLSQFSCTSVFHFPHCIAISHLLALLL